MIEHIVGLIRKPGLMIDENTPLVSSGLIDSLEEICKQGPAVIDPAPTFVTQTSFKDALLAAGGTVAQHVCNRDRRRDALRVLDTEVGVEARPARALGKVELSGGRERSEGSAVPPQNADPSLRSG